MQATTIEILLLLYIIDISFLRPLPSTFLKLVLSKTSTAKECEYTASFLKEKKVKFSSDPSKISS
jgi:hypothetical protein